MYLALTLLIVVAATAVTARATMTIVRVHGSSMAPSLRPGDRVLTLRTGVGRGIRRGDLVVCHHPVIGVANIPGVKPYLIKRVVAVGGDSMAAVGRDGVVPSGHLALLGDRPESYDSRAFGAIARDQVVGRVLRRLPT